MKKIIVFLSALVISNSGYAMEQSIMSDDDYLKQYHHNKDALIEAAKQNDLECVKHFLTLKALPSNECPNALHYALLHKNQEMVNTLTQKVHSKISALEIGFYGSFQDAAQENNIEAIIMLMNSKGSNHLKEIGIRLSLTIACSNNYANMIKTIMENYASFIESPCRNGSFRYAVQKGYTEVVRSMLSHTESNPFEKNGSDQTPLEIAKENNDSEMINILTEASKQYLIKLKQQQLALAKQIVELQNLLK